MKSIIKLLILALTLTLNINAQEKPTNWSFGAGLYGNFNLYNSSFKQISNIPNCCTNFDQALGYGFGYFGFGEYSFKEVNFPNDWKAGISLSFGDISAQFSEQSIIGNIISGNTYIKGESEYIIDVNLFGIGVEPYMSFKPISSIPLNFKVGFQLFVPTRKYFSQSETLISPSGNATFENDKRIRNEAEGDIPQFSGALLLPSVGLKYDLFTVSDFLVSGFSNFYFGIHDAVTNLEWKVNYANAGLSFKYDIPKAKALPPPPPPEPELPAPPRESILTHSLEVKNKGNILQNYDNVQMNIFRDKYIFSTPVLPVVFYDFNTSTINKYDKFDPMINGSNYITDIVFNEFIKDSNLKLKIIHSYITSEDKTIVDARINNFLKYFNKIFQNKFDITRLIIQENPKEESDFENNALMQEAINIKFELIEDDKPRDLVYYQNIIYKNISSDTLKFEINPIVQADAQPVKIQGEIEHNGKIIDNFDQKISYNYYERNLSKYDNDVNNILINTLRIRTDVIDAENKTKSENLQLNLEYLMNNKNVYNFNSYNDSVRTYILGFFDFDEYEFSQINYFAIEEYKKAKELGYEVVLLASTDNIGAEDYNQKLAQKRYAAALKLLKAKNEKIPFEYPEQYLFDNNFSQGRAYNRSVIIKVIPK